MNTKKLLISGAIATGMLVGVAMPSVFAANKITFQKDYIKAGETVTIMQNNNGKKANSIDLTAKTVKEAIEKKFTGTTVKGELKTVGTGTVVELADGVKITVVYKGDVNGDGKISVADAGWMVRSSFKNGKVKLNETQKKAGDIGGKVEEVNSSDAGVVVRLLFGGNNATKAYNKMQEFMPEDVVVVDDKKVVESIKDVVTKNEATKDLCTVGEIKYENGVAKIPVTINADKKDTKLADLKSELKGTVTTFVNDNQELVEAAKSVTINYPNYPTLTISKEQIADILTNPENEARVLINKYIGDKTLAALAGDKLTVTVDLDETANALLNNAKEDGKVVYEIDFASLAK